MKKTVVLTTILLLSLFLLLFDSQNITQASMCPSNMDPSSQECLDYLREQLANVNKQQSTLESNLKNEQYQQLSLQEKIAYINNQIEQTEEIISTLEMEIAAKDIEIGLLAKEIKTKEDDISLLTQEISILKETVDKRVTESYKYSFLRPLELFLDVKNIDSVLRKTKYLLETRTKDRNSLQHYNDFSIQLEQEEHLLANKKADVQKIRNDSEEENNQLKQEKIELNEQKAERTKLLAESEEKEKEFLNTLESNRSKQAAIDDEIMKYIQLYGDKMANYGWVSAGTWIGRMGGLPSLCSTGPHLHFSIDVIGSGYYEGFGQISPWEGYLTKGPDYWLQSASGWKYYYVRSANMRVPVGKTAILTQDHHSAIRKAIDISIPWAEGPYGTPIYAAMSGTLYKGVDRCGETYAVIYHSNGLRTGYFHLQKP
jgi:peptidoglycan hydrolase CwlO-like protein